MDTPSAFVKKLSDYESSDLIRHGLLVPKKTKKFFQALDENEKNPRTGIDARFDHPETEQMYLTFVYYNWAKNEYRLSGFPWRISEDMSPGSLLVFRADSAEGNGIVTVNMVSGEEGAPIVRLLDESNLSAAVYSQAELDALLHRDISPGVTTEASTEKVAYDPAFLHEIDSEPNILHVSEDILGTPRAGKSTGTAPVERPSIHSLNLGAMTEDIYVLIGVALSAAGGKFVFNLISEWVRLKNGRKIRMKQGDFEVEIQGDVSAKQVEKFAEAFRANQSKSADKPTEIIVVKQ